MDNERFMLKHYIMNILILNEEHAILGNSPATKNAEYKEC